MLQHASRRAVSYNCNALQRLKKLSIASQRRSVTIPLPHFTHKTLSHKLSVDETTSIDADLFQHVSQDSHSHLPGIRARNLEQETIYALSSAPGRAGIAVIRISGPACRDIYQSLCKNEQALAPRHAHVRTLYEPNSGTEMKVLDTQTVVLNLPGPNTQTGEDMLELHIHGGNATVKAVLQGVSKVPSKYTTRYAEAGEFTRRAFMGGKLNLAQVEALSDQLSAETEQQRRAAVRGSSKFLGKKYEEWRESLLQARGEMEALIDFSEDQHFDESPTQLLQGITEKVNDMLMSIAQHEAASHRGELLKRGIRISLLGPPNAGKSSSLNQFVGREASIVSSEAGTTRDIVEVTLDIRGYLCTFADTAGLREELPRSTSTGTSKLIISSIEAEGIRRAKSKASESDLVIALASVIPSARACSGFEIDFDPESIALAAAAPSSIIVVNKMDILPKDGPANMEQMLFDAFKRQIQPVIDLDKTPVTGISCEKARIDEKLFAQGKDPGGINRLTGIIASIFKKMTDLPPDMQDLLGVTERSRQLLVQTRVALEAYLTEAEKGSEGGEPDIVIAAEELREAAARLALITGRGEMSDSEEVLGVVFEKFCVGK